MLSPHEKVAAIDNLKKAIDQLESMPTTTRCIDCKSFTDGLCAQFGEVIPKDVLEGGCEKFDFNSFSPPF